MELECRVSFLYLSPFLLPRQPPPSFRTDQNEYVRVDVRAQYSRTRACLSRRVTLSSAIIYHFIFRNNTYGTIVVRCFVCFCPDREYLH